MSDGVRVTRDGAVATVVLDRPERRNAVDRTTARALIDTFATLDRDRDVRAVILTGSGGDFCTGGDVTGGDEAPDNPIDYRHAADVHGQLSRSLWDFETPVVSAVNGRVAGLGWMLALLADLVVADRDARWTHAFTRRGMAPHAGDTYFLPRVIPFHRLNQLALVGGTVRSETLYDWGVVNELADSGGALAAASALAARLAEGPTRALAFTKRLYRQSIAGDIEAAFDAERNATALLSTTVDRREGVQALIEGRPARFIGS